MTSASNTAAGLSLSRRRRWPAPVLLVVALLAAACGSDSSQEASPTTAAEVVAVGGIEPEVVCVDRDEGPAGDVAFAYVNTGDTGAIVAAGDSIVTNGEEADLAYVPVVFAVGRNSPAFWVTPLDPEAPVTWSVIGPDGIERTAASGPDTPSCTAELEAPVPPDPRQPALAIVDLEVSEDRSIARLAVELTGVPELSVCGTGLEPRPVSIAFTVATVVAGQPVSVSAEGPIIEFDSDPSPEIGLASRLVSVLVLDQCALDEIVQPSWPGGAFHEVYEAELCVVLADGEVSAYVYGEDGTCGLPRTGGGRGRPA